MCGYRPVLREVQKVLNEAQMPLMPNEEYKFVFREKPPMIGWREACILKDYLERAKITNRYTE